MTPSGVRKFRHPSSSSSPNTPHDDSLGLSGLIGSSEKRGTLLRSILVAIASAPWRKLRVAGFHRSRRPFVEHVGFALHVGRAVGKFLCDEAARLVKAARGGVALKCPQMKTGGAKTLGMREHRVADPAALLARCHVKLIDVVAVKRQHRNDSAVIFGNPSLALRHHLMDHERANLRVAADGWQISSSAAPRGDIHGRDLLCVGGIRASENDSHQCRFPSESGALSRLCTFAFPRGRPKVNETFRFNAAYHL